MSKNRLFSNRMFSNRTFSNRTSANGPFANGPFANGPFANGVFHARRRWSPLALLYLPGIAALAALDQLTKLWALRALGGTRVIPILGHYVQLAYTPNAGAAFSILQNQRAFLIAVPAVFTAVCLYFLLAEKLPYALANTALTLIAAGGAGNLIDRVFRGSVVDFIDCTGIHFAVFNVADSCVTVGAALLVLFVILHERDAEGTKHGGAYSRHGKY